jgi:hypothetical protein
LGALNFELSKDLRDEPTRLDAASVLGDPRKCVPVPLRALLERKLGRWRRNEVNGLERVIGRRHGAADGKKQVKLTLLCTKHLLEGLDVRLEMADHVRRIREHPRIAITVHKLTCNVLKLANAKELLG